MSHSAPHPRSEQPQGAPRSGAEDSAGTIRWQPVPAGSGQQQDPSCFRCSSALSQPLVCEGCGLLQPLPGAIDPFALFSLAPAAELDLELLRKRLTALSRRVHPDFYANAGAEERERAQASAAELNGAFELLSDETRRIEHLIARGGGPGAEQERQMPAAFLAEVLEWNESLDEARQGDPRALAGLEKLAGELRERLGAERAALRGLLTPLPEPGSPKYRDARRVLNAVRYLERAAAECAERRLDRANRTESTT
jgi:molecular chaperone HscB